ncbi:MULTISPECIES: hypothetical protein [Bradyrhizobium]|uniref:hypothetical protein n=1 Tax=Bradyrhizobium TaxID=374 RepID=UPI0004B7C0E3|nr:hypothetical protein [Bradyrhizobium elkanii]MBP2434069.1 hypothetical protein [Bradyrhizobium elkanii]WLA85773.1 hypothetical protein QNJ99_17090 [Bradyrhizobium elkanii]WLA88998.1 hypothetical protein QNJ96_28395 [Bradyrhizobium elkanii]
MFIADRFDSRTVAILDLALEAACQHLPKGTDDHKARCYIARRIIKWAEKGDHTLEGLSEAARAAALELTAKRAA